MADRISSLSVPVRPCSLAGSTYFVYEARLSDLVILQQWVDSRWPDPADGLLERLAEVGDDPVARDKILFTVWGEIAEGPPVFDSEQGQVLLFGTTGGMAEFLRVILSRGSPTADCANLARIVSEGSVEALGWFSEVCRVFYGNDSVDLVKGLLGCPREMSGGESLSWSEAVVTLAKEFGWTIEQVLALSLSQFMTCHSGGKPREHTLRLTHDQIKAFNDRRCMALYGEIPTEQVARPVG